MLRHPFLRLLMPCLALLLAAGSARAADYRIETIAQGLEHPWSLAFLPDGSALVTERAGRLRVIERGLLRNAPVEGLPALFVSGQAGLFEVLPDPGFAANRTLFLSFACGLPDANRLCVIRARFDGVRLSEHAPVFDARPDKRGDAHYGGRMAWFGDGTLAIAVGDGFTLRESAQRLDNHLGKIVRVGRDGSTPPDNPFVGRAGALAQIWSLGHRNPQALVFDSASDTLFAHEHGPRGGDELNRIVAGANYGWPLATFGVDYTGARVSPWHERAGMQPPLLHWTPSIAPAGMTHYDGALFPLWRGSLFVAALAERSVRRVPLVDGVPGPQQILFTELGERFRDVRSGPDGALWLLTDSADGRVLRVTPGSD